MCIAVPMRIVEAEGLSAVARREDAPDLKVDTSLVGELAPGDWVLVFRDSVIRTVSEEEAERIGRALACVSAVMAGDESAAAEAAGSLGLAGGAPGPPPLPARARKKEGRFIAQAKPPL